MSQRKTVWFTTLDIMLCVLCPASALHSLLFTYGFDSSINIGGFGSSVLPSTSTYCIYIPQFPTHEQSYLYSLLFLAPHIYTQICNTLHFTCSYILSFQTPLLTIGPLLHSPLTHFLKHASTHFWYMLPQQRSLGYEI